MLMSAIGSVDSVESPNSASPSNKASLSDEKNTNGKLKLNHVLDSNKSAYSLAELRSKLPRQNGFGRLFVEKDQTKNGERYSQRIKRTVECPPEALVFTNEVSPSSEKAPVNGRIVTAQEKTALLNVKISKHLSAGGKRAAPEEGQKKLSKNSPCRNLFASEERAFEEGISAHTFLTSSVSSCSYCFKNKKTSSLADTPEADAWKSVEEEGSKTEGRVHKAPHHSTPGPSTPPSSSIPSTPNEER